MCLTRDAPAEWKRISILLTRISSPISPGMYLCQEARLPYIATLVNEDWSTLSPKKTSKIWRVNNMNETVAWTLIVQITAFCLTQMLTYNVNDWTGRTWQLSQEAALNKQQKAGVSCNVNRWYFQTNRDTPRQSWRCICKWSQAHIKTTLTKESIKDKFKEKMRIIPPLWPEKHSNKQTCYAKHGVYKSWENKS